MQIQSPLFTLPQAMFWEVRLGEHNQKNTEDEEKTLSISHVFHYPWYRGYDNDIAVMKLSEPIKVTEYVRPICVPDERTSFFGKECVATGWGKVDYNKKASNILQKVAVDVYEISECQNAYYPKFRISIDQWHLCAGTRDGGRGTCHGDSGGPLQCRVNGKWMIAGITSFGSGCAKPGFPDVFTNVAYFTNWIKEMMKSTK